MPPHLWRDLQQGEKSPGIGIPAALLPVIAKSHQQRGKTLLAHILPREKQADVCYLARRRRQPVESEAGDDTEIAASRPSTGAKQVRIVVRIHTPRCYLAIGIHREDIDGSSPVAGKPVEPR